MVRHGARESGSSDEPALESADVNAPGSLEDHAASQHGAGRVSLGASFGSLDRTESVSLRGVEEAVRHLRAPISNTPLTRSAPLSAALDADVYLKIECVGPTASFKARGALTAVRRALGRRPYAAVVTSSTGNHGQGVAFAAQEFELPSHIFLPSDANPVKRAAIELMAAVTHDIDGDVDKAKAGARDFARQHDYLFIDDGDNPDVIEGAGTIGVEILDQAKVVDDIFVPMGGGSLASGVALATKRQHHSPRVTAVQSTGSPAMAESFHQRMAVECPVNTLADGLQCRVPAMLALSCLVNFVSDVVTVPDELLLAAARSLLEAGHLLVEPSAAAALAGAWTARRGLRGKKVVLVITGANITLPVLKRVIDRPLLESV